MGTFTYGSDDVTITATPDIVLRRLPLDPNGSDRERFVLHRRVTYSVGTDETDGPFEYTVSAPGDELLETDLASVPQLLTWLVPKSGRHLPAALVHDAMVDDDAIDRFEADRRFRDGMGDLGVGLVRRWLMWTAVSLKTIEKRGTIGLRLGVLVTLVAVIVLGTLATINLVTDRTLVPWMGSRGLIAELVLGLSGAVVVPMAIAVVFWKPIRIAGVIAGVAAAVLVHAVALTGAVYLLYLALERLPRPLLATLGALVAVAAAVAFTVGVVTTLG